MPTFPTGYTILVRFLVLSGALSCIFVLLGLIFQKSDVQIMEDIREDGF